MTNNDNNIRHHHHYCTFRRNNNDGGDDNDDVDGKDDNNDTIFRQQEINRSINTIKLKIITTTHKMKTIPAINGLGLTYIGPIIPP